MFLLSEHNAFSYLVELGICDSRRMPIEILPLSGKNLNLHLKFVDSPDWLIKQEVIDQQGCNELFLGEWAVQDLINSTDRLAPLREFIPPIVYYDRSASILVSQFLEGHQNLSGYYKALDCPFDRGIAVAQGRHLGTLHQLTYQQGQTGRAHLQNNYPDAVRSNPPSKHSPLEPFIPEMFGWVRQDALTFFRWYQSQPELIQALEQLSETWRPCCLTHQDLQFGNWLLNRESRSLQLIDWEHMGWGDPLTDLATLLSNPLQLWLSRLPPPSSGSSWQQRCDAATLPFEKLQPSLIALIDSYFEAFPEALSEDALPRILQWAGRRLIHEVETSIQYHYLIGSIEANLLHFAQQLILYPDVLVPVLFDRSP